MFVKLFLEFLFYQRQEKKYNAEGRKTLRCTFSCKSSSAKRRIVALKYRGAYKLDYIFC